MHSRMLINWLAITWAVQVMTGLEVSCWLFLPFNAFSTPALSGVQIARLEGLLPVPAPQTRQGHVPSAVQQEEEEEEAGVVDPRGGSDG